MLRSLRSNWIWIVAPIVLVAIAVIVLLAFSSDAVDTGVYTIF